MCSYMWLLFWITNIGNNIIWDPTSGIKARLSGSNGQRRRQGFKNWEVCWHKHWILEDADKRLSIWEEVASTSFGDIMKDEEWNLLDRQVLGVIQLTLSRLVAHSVVKEKTKVDLMKALSGMYEKPLYNNKVHLMK